MIRIKENQKAISFIAGIIGWLIAKFTLIDLVAFIFWSIAGTLIYSYLPKEHEKLLTNLYSDSGKYIAAFIACTAIGYFNKKWVCILFFIVGFYLFEVDKLIQIDWKHFTFYDATTIKLLFIIPTMSVIGILLGKVIKKYN